MIMIIQLLLIQPQILILIPILLLIPILIPMQIPIIIIILMMIMMMIITTITIIPITIIVMTIPMIDYQNVLKIQQKSYSTVTIKSKEDCYGLTKETASTCKDTLLKD